MYSPLKLDSLVLLLSPQFLHCADASGMHQKPLEKAHIVRAEKKKRREEIKAKRLAILKAAREKKAKAKKA